MARRRESIIDALLVLPWWVSVIAAAGAYVLLAFALPAYFAANPITAGIGLAAQKYAPFVTGFFLVIGFLRFVRSHVIKRRFDGLESMAQVRQLSWRQFESIVGEAFRRRGYAVVENAVDGPDGGIDLVLRKGGEKFYVQCKQWKQGKVGVKPIRELYGVIAAGEAAGGFFVASAEYTQEARDFARKCGIELIDGAALVGMIAEARAQEPPLDSTNRKRTELAAESPARYPTCPACGGTMVQRTARRGENAGSVFWGCRSYPRCRGTRPA